MYPEQRQSARTSTDRVATIRTEDSSLEVSCVVCNLSEGGAKLILEEQKLLPTEFVLVLRSGSPLGRRCQIIWRLGNKLGVRFVSVFELDKASHKGSGVWAPE
jgi:hypothetical protein